MRVMAGDWRVATLAAAPLLAASLLTQWWVRPVVLDSQAWTIAGLIVVATALTLGLAQRSRAWPAGRAALATAGALGVATPALAIATSLLARARADPAMIVVTPSWFALGLLGLSVLIAWGLSLTLAARSPFLTVMLLTPGVLLVWLPRLGQTGVDALFWAALSATFALLGALWFAVVLLPARLTTISAIVAAGLAWAMALGASLPIGWASEGGTLVWSMALAASIAPFVIGVAPSRWPARRPHDGTVAAPVS